MKIFLDTNIFLDLILKREKYQDALIILNSVESSLFDATILDITLLNIDYIAKKQVKDIKEFLNAINSSFEVVGANNQHITKALNLQNIDFEDNLQYTLAKESRCKIIVSNDKDFIKKDIEVLSSSEFIMRFDLQ